MANTVSLLTYDNTFADWMIATNYLAQENNNLAANDYIKTTGTLFLNDTSKTGLVVANNATIGGTLQVQGTGSAAYIQRNLQVDGQVYFTNPTLSVTTAGQANIGGPILALSSGNGIVVSNNAIVSGNISIGKSTTIGASLNVGTFAKVGTNLTVGGNTSTLNALVYNSTETGSLIVDNGAFVGDSLSVVNSINTNYVTANNKVSTRSILSIIDVTTGVVQANTSVNTALVYTNTINVLNDAYTNTLKANVSVNTAALFATSFVNTASLMVTGTTVLTGKANTVNDLGIGGNQYISGNQVVTGNEIISGTLNVTGNSTLTGKANTVNDLGVGGNQYVTGNQVVTGNEIITGTLNVTGKTTLSQANTTNDLGVAGNQYVTGNQVITGNHSVTGNETVSGNVTVTGTTTLTGKANTTNDLGVGGNQYVSGNQTITGNEIISGTLNVTGATTLVAKANTTNDLGVGGNQYVTGNQIITGRTTLTSQANTTNDLGIGGSLYSSRIVIPIGGTIIGDSGQGGATISANSVAVGSGGLSVSGNFTINGTTVYNSNQFVLSSATPNPAYGSFGVFRNTNGSSNSYIRWNEGNKNWDLTANSATEPYYRILTDQYINNTGTLNSSSNVASSYALANANTFLQTTISSANTQLKSYVDGQITSTLAYTSGVDASQNTRLSTVEANTIYLFGALNQTNTNISSANTQLKSYVDGLNTIVNSNISYISGVDGTQNTRLSTVEANTIYLFGALNATNTNYASAITSANTQLKAYTDGAIVSANTQLKNYVDGRFVTPTFTGAGSITGDFSITGNLLVNGTTTTINTSTVTTNDSLIKLAANNTTGDIVDSGFYGTYNSSGVKYAGLIREGSGGTNAGTFYLFKDLATDPTSNTVNYAGLSKASLVADGSLITGLSASNILTGTVGSGITWNGNIIGITYGGTNNNSYTNNTLTFYNGTSIVSLANVASAGTYGDGTTVPRITVDNFGRVTSVSNYAIAASGAVVSYDNTSSTVYYPALTTLTGGQLTAVAVANNLLQFVASTGTLSVPKIGSGSTWNGNVIGASYGGTGLSSFTSGGAVYATGTTALTTGTLPTTAGGTGITSFTSGGAIYASSSSVLTSGTLPITAGGTGQTTAQAALNALSGGVTSGYYLRGNGTNVVLTQIPASDIPTLNQNTTGTANNITAFTINQNVGSSDSPTFAQLKATKGYREGVVNVGTVSGATNLDLSQGNIFNVTLNGSSVPFTFINGPSSGTACYVTVLLTQAGSGGPYTFGSFTSSQWTDGAKPVLSTGANKTDILTFFTTGNGIYYGAFTGANFGP